MGANPGQLLFGKAVTIQGLTTFEASSSTRIPPIYKIQVLELKKHLHKLNPVISRDTLWEYDSEIQSLYQSIYNAVTKPQMPTLHNTDGDLLIPHKLTYTLSVSPEDALNALADLNCSESKQEILEYADFENGSLKKVGFPWIKKGNSKHAAMENTVLGHIEIDGSKMTVNLNSENRANEFESQMRERLDGGYKLNCFAATHLRYQGGASLVDEKSI